MDLEKVIEIKIGKINLKQGCDILFMAGAYALAKKVETVFLTKKQFFALLPSYFFYIEPLNAESIMKKGGFKFMDTNFELVNQ